MNFLALKLIQHLLPTGSIKNLGTGSYFCHKFGEFSSTKIDSTCNSYWLNEILIQAYIFAINLVNFLALKLIQHLLPIRLIKNLDTCSFCAINLVNFLATKWTATCDIYWVSEILRFIN